MPLARFEFLNPARSCQIWKSNHDNLKINTHQNDGTEEIKNLVISSPVTGSCGSILARADYHHSLCCKERSAMHTCYSAVHMSQESWPKAALYPLDSDSNQTDNIHWPCSWTAGPTSLLYQVLQFQRNSALFFKIKRKTNITSITSIIVVIRRNVSIKSYLNWLIHLLN